MSDLVKLHEKAVENCSNSADREMLSLFFCKGAWRTLLDPFCEEWKNTSMDEKVAILRAFKHCGVDLQQIVLAYRDHYKEKGRKDIVQATESGLIHLLQHTL
jgi:hypothetical protein